MEYSKLGDVLGLSARDAKQLAGHIAERWNSDETRGVMLLTFDKSCQLCTNEKYLPYIREALGILNPEPEEESENNPENKNDDEK